LHQDGHIAEKIVPTALKFMQDLVLLGKRDLGYYLINFIFIVTGYKLKKLTIP
jgi:hypothetical protein